MSGQGVSLEVDAILSEARQRAGGLDNLGDGPFLAPLRLLLDSLERESRLIARERVLGHTVNRLDYVADRKRFPEIAREEIARPVFIIGLPRTGTTILHDILAQDPDDRAPLTWMSSGPLKSHEERFMGRHLVETRAIFRKKREERIVQTGHAVFALEHVQ